MQVTFDTLKIEANIFSELKKNPEWFEHCKNDNSLYIEIRKDNQVNIYLIDLIHSIPSHSQCQAFLKLLSLP